MRGMNRRLAGWCGVVVGFYLVAMGAVILAAFGMAWLCQRADVAEWWLR